MTKDIDRTKHINIKQDVQVEQFQSPTVNQITTSHSTGDTECQNAMISALCEVRLENLTLTNEDKGYMNSLIENNNSAETKCSSEDDSILTGVKEKTKDDGKPLW